MKIRLIAIAALAAVLLALPGSASADDRAVYDAWTRHDAEGVKLLKRSDRAAKRWERSNYRNWRPLYRASKATVRFMRRVEADVAAQSGSSSTGRKARVLALKSVRFE
jgi:hypothetical protein